MVNYRYDFWTKLIRITETGQGTLGLKNPFCYRGYYYDNETRFYYLNGRYCDSETGHFINPDVEHGCE